MDKQICYSTNKHEEMFTLNSIDEVVEEYLDSFPYVDEPPLKEFLKENGIVTVYVYEQEVIDPNFKKELKMDLIDWMSDSLDENYGGSEEANEVTEGMRVLAQYFINNFCEEYDVQRYKEAGEISVDAVKWIKENRPDWAKMYIEENNGPK